MQEEQIAASQKTAVLRGSMQCGMNFSGIATVSREYLAIELALTLCTSPHMPGLW
jgi:hypothetical protein